MPFGHKILQQHAGRSDSMDSSGVPKHVSTVKSDSKPGTGVAATSALIKSRLPCNEQTSRNHRCGLTEVTKQQRLLF